MKKGFTLLELLIVIGILAIISTTMILVINPAELLRKARDVQRLSDLTSIRTALSYYLTSISSPNLGNTSYWYVYAHPGLTFSGNCGTRTASSTASQAVDGYGWIPVRLSDLTGGSPIPAYPIDPNPAQGKRYYIYIPSNTTFELLANMESTTYTSQESTDGGNLPDVYEIGTQFIVTSTTGCYTDTGT